MGLIKLLVSENYKIFGKIFNFYSISSLSIFLFLPSLLLFILYIIFKFIDYKVIPGQFQNFVETIYDILESFILDQITEDCVEYVPYLMGIFFYILSLNLMNLVPYFPSATSQFFVNFTISFIICFSLFLISIYNKGINFWQQFVPSGVPTLMKPLLFILEFLLYWIKPITLACRLALALSIGHEVLHIIVKLKLEMIGGRVLIFVLSFTVLALELFVMFLQPFLFLLLTCIYLKDMIASH